MGEYAKVKGTGEEIKIGTCEDMYYLRADQRHDVWAVRGNVDPVRDVAEIRFRFPWPDEDEIEPGCFEQPFRSLAVPGATLPTDWPGDHGHVQFVSDRGYNVCLPCPEGPDADGRVHRNGFPGAVRIVQQRAWDGYWATVIECGGCGYKWRLETFELAEQVITRALDAEAIHRGFRDSDGVEHPSEYWAEIARRVRLGYATRVDSLPVTV